MRAGIIPGTGTEARTACLYREAQALMFAEQDE
jgi:hypothetical protein